MTRACNSAGDEQELRQAVGGNGDCVICLREKPGGDALNVIQVIEGMSHDRKKKRVDIPLLMVVHNPHDTAVAMRIVHRAFVTASLKRFHFDSSGGENWEDHDPRKKQMMDVLRGLYAGRLWRHEKTGIPLFLRRINCLGLRQKADELSLEGFNKYFTEKGEYDLEPEFPQDKTPSYCSYLLPTVAPKQIELFVIWLTFDGESYERLIGDNGIFTVDSYTRLLRQIKAFDLDLASPEGRKFYHNHIESDNSIIAPDAYDIVIFQGDQDAPIAVEAGSICILQVQSDKEHLSKQSLWFYGQPEEFYLILRYESAAAPKPASNGFVISNDVSHHVEMASP